MASVYYNYKYHLQVLSLFLAELLSGPRARVGPHIHIVCVSMRVYFDAQNKPCDEEGNDAPSFM